MPQSQQSAFGRGVPDERDQAFAAVAEETDYRRMAAVGYAAAFVLVVAVVFGITTWRQYATLASSSF